MLIDKIDHAIQLVIYEELERLLRSEGYFIKIDNDYCHADGTRFLAVYDDSSAWTDASIQESTDIWVGNHVTVVPTMAVKNYSTNYWPFNMYSHVKVLHNEYVNKPERIFQFNQPDLFQSVLKAVNDFLYLDNLVYVSQHIRSWMVKQGRQPGLPC